MSDLLNYEGKVVLVTGARTGIGKATAIAFAKQGAKVVLSGRRPCDETSAEIDTFGGESTFIKCDISVAEEIKNLVEKTVETYGRLDVAVNNAGSLPPTKPLIEQTVEEYDEIMAIDARGVFLGMKYQIPELLKVGGGAIVNIASIAGLVADPGMAPYVAAKHAVVGMTKAAGIEYASQNIRINAVAPGFVGTEMTSGWMEDPEMKALVESYNFQKRIADPSEMAGICLFLGSEMASFASGSVFTIDAGQTAH